MIIVKTPSQYNVNYVFFNEKVDNKIIGGAEFSRVIYSNHELTFHGAYVSIDLVGTKYTSFENKNCISYDTANVHNNKIICFFKQLEIDILNKFDSTILKRYKLRDYLSNGILKLITDRSPTHYKIILKISGVWSTSQCCGLTFKLIYI